MRKGATNSERENNMKRVRNGNTGRNENKQTENTWTM